jgi:hypothetical protein
MHKPDEIATKLSGAPFETLDERAKNVARPLAGRKHIAGGDPGADHLRGPRQTKIREPDIAVCQERTTNLSRTRRSMVRSMS